MTRDNESIDGIDRRTVLKGTAVAGLAGSGVVGSASAGGWSELTLCAAGDDLFYFRVEVSGKLKRGGKYLSDEHDEVGSNYVDGQVWKDNCDSYLFTGDVEKLKLQGPGKVYLDGELIEDTTAEYPHKVTIEGQGDVASYEFTVSGRVKPGDRASKGDEILDSSTVRGAVQGDGVDTFWFDGSIAFDEVDERLSVTIDFNAT